MQDTLGKEGGTPDPIALNYVFSHTTPEFREEVVRRALTSRDTVSATARDALSRAVSKSSVAVSGFRNAGLAPSERLITPVTDRVQGNAELAAAVLRVWAESQKELRELIASHLETCGVAIQGLDFRGNTIRFPVDDRPLMNAFISFNDINPEAADEEVTLLIELLTGTMIGFSHPEVEPENPVGRTLENTLDVLTALSPTAPEWEELIPNFLASVNELLETKRKELHAAASLDDLFAEIGERYGELLQFFQLQFFQQFFQWNSRRWFAANLLAGVGLQEAYGLAVELNDLLSQYAPIHERAAVASEEMTRIAPRMDLMPRIQDAGSALDGMMEPGEGPDDDPDDDDVGRPARRPGPDSTPAPEAPASEAPGASETVLSETVLSETVLSEEPANPGNAGTVGLNTEGSSENSAEVSAEGSANNSGEKSGAGFLEVPPCHIEDYLLMRLENQDLELENDELEKEVQSLKEQLFESRNRGEGWRLALASQDNEAAAVVAGEEDDRIDDVNAAVELAKAKFVGQLLFHFNSDSTIADNSFKWPERVWQALEWLATDYYESRVGLATNPDLDGSCRLASGMWYKTSQHDNTMAAYRNSYTTRVDGRLIWLREHIGKGTGFDPRRTIRIGFDWDRTLQKVIIGYLGQHQRTAAS